MYSASCFWSVSAGSTVVDGGAGTDHRDLVADGHHLVELVRDEDHGCAVGNELLEVLEQLVDLLRNQHGGRLVEDQDLGAAVQHLEDLDPLALADPEVGDQGVEIDLDTGRGGDLAEPVVGSLQIESAAADRVRRRG